jgi:integrase/recombinase XerD
MPTDIKAYPAVHHTKKIIVVNFNNDAELIKRFKQLPGAKWSQTLKSWYLPDTAAYRKQFNIVPTPIIGKDALQHIHEVNKPALQQMEQLLILKNYSTSTQKTYLIEFAQLLYILNKNPVNTISYDKLGRYFSWCITTNNISASQLHSRINAIKFYFEQVLKKENFSYEIPRPKKSLLLPKVISEDAILRLLNAAENQKHKLLLSLCYGMGLRVSELCNLKITDIDSSRMQVNIVAGKGKKDRYVNLPHSILAALRLYYKHTNQRCIYLKGNMVVSIA